MQLTQLPPFLLLVAVLSTPLPAQSVRSVKDAYDLIHAGPLNEEGAQALAEFIQSRSGGNDLSQGTHRHLLQPREEGGGYALWFLKAPADAQVAVVAEKGRRWPMVPLGDGALWVWAEKFDNFSSVHYRYDVNGQRLGGGRNNRFGFESYPWLPESMPQEGVPKGELIDMGTHVSTTHFPGAERQWWIYVPAQYDPARKDDVKLIVFNDGGGFARGDGNACTVLDNLIHAGKVPVTIAVFVNPGTFPPVRQGASRFRIGGMSTTPARRVSPRF